jgi:hypothetical protein
MLASEATARAPLFLMSLQHRYVRSGDGGPLTVATTRRLLRQHMVDPVPST